jgi:predicted ATP-binding protein involved in virulence
MRIKSIGITNFKGIEKLNLEFKLQSNITLIIGENGSGKTSILDALSIALGTFLIKTGSSFGISGQKSRPLFNHEVKRIMYNSENIEFENVMLFGLFDFEGEEIEFCRDKQSYNKNLNIKYSKKLTDKGFELIKKLKEPINLPVIAYHSTGRLWGEIKTEYKSAGSRLDGYYACLDPRNIKQKFLSWFKTYEDNVLKFDVNKDLYYAFTESIISMIPEWEKIHYNWKLNDLVGFNKSTKEWETFSTLSDGYKSILSLAADISYRAIILNPHLGKEAVKLSKGIVLIDEIDLHLHPKWQKSIISDLKKTFPNIQFVLTTHSPFIIQSVSENELINLENDKTILTPKNEPISKIISEIMGVADLYSDDFKNRHEIALKKLEAIQKSNELLTQDDYLEIKKQIDSILIQDSNDPILKAYLEVKK